MLAAMKPKDSHHPFPKRRALLGWLSVSVVAFGLIDSTTTYAAGATKSVAPDSPYIGQSQIAATILQSMRPVGVFQVDMGILVPNAAQRARAASLQPVLRDAWRRTVQEFANSYITPGRVPDAVLLGQRLQAATDRVLGAGTARVLLTSVIVR
jgi:hypothetical protein